MPRIERDRERSYHEPRERLSKYDSLPPRNEDDDALYFSDCVMFPPRENRGK